MHPYQTTKTDALARSRVAVRTAFANAALIDTQISQLAKLFDHCLKRQSYHGFVRIARQSNLVIAIRLGCENIALIWRRQVPCDGGQQLLNTFVLERTAHQHGRHRAVNRGGPNDSPNFLDRWFCTTVDRFHQLFVQQCQ